jgi:hypothetical protein
MLKLITVSSRRVDAECSNLGYVKVQATDISAFLIDRDDGLPLLSPVNGQGSSVIICERVNTNALRDVYINRRKADVMILLREEEEDAGERIFLAAPCLDDADA